MDRLASGLPEEAREEGRKALERAKAQAEKVSNGANPEEMLSAAIGMLGDVQALLLKAQQRKAKDGTQ